MAFTSAGDRAGTSGVSCAPSNAGASIAGMTIYSDESMIARVTLHHLHVFSFMLVAYRKHGSLEYHASITVHPIPPVVLRLGA